MTAPPGTTTNGLTIVTEGDVQPATRTFDRDAAVAAESKADRKRRQKEEAAAAAAAAAVVASDLLRRRRPPGRGPQGRLRPPASAQAGRGSSPPSCSSPFSAAAPRRPTSPRRPETTVLADYALRPATEVQAELEARGLVVTLQSESSELIEAGLVLRQDPGADTSSPRATPSPWSSRRASRRSCCPTSAATASTRSPPSSPPSASRSVTSSGSSTRPGPRTSCWATPRAPRPRSPSLVGQPAGQRRGEAPHHPEGPLRWHQGSRHRPAPGPGPEGRLLRGLLAHHRCGPGHPDRPARRLHRREGQHGHRAGLAGQGAGQDPGLDRGHVGERRHLHAHQRSASPSAACRAAPTRRSPAPPGRRHRGQARLRRHPHHQVAPPPDARPFWWSCRVTGRAVP